MQQTGQDRKINIIRKKQNFNLFHSYNNCELIILKLERWNFIMFKENVSATYEAHNPNELLTGLEAKSEYILIKGDYFKEVRKIMDTHLSENERLGVELGGAGVITLLIYALDRVRDLFSNSDKMNKKIDRKLNLYKVKKITDDGLLLGLKQLDY